MKCKDCEDYRPYNNSAYGYCRLTLRNVSEDVLCFNPSKQTNADRIRSMTDEELAEFLDKVSCGCEECPKERECMYPLTQFDVELPCSKVLLKWLKEEIKCQVK